jgi:V8-like Glu-specific endopeptidase
MLVVHHKTGPLAGTEQRITPTGDRVTFGRDPTVCDVVYPPDATIVARRHFALVRMPSGEWTFQLFGDPFVAVDGAPADTGMAVHSGANIELGKYGGPSFGLELQDEGLKDGMLLTAPQHKVMGAHAAADHAEHSAIRARRVAVVGVVVALFAAIGAGAFYYVANSSAERLNKAIAELGRAQSATAAESISQEVRDRVLQAAYLVILRNANGARMADGTASPIAADTLATNAHIVELFERLGPGEKMLVRSPGENGRDYEVIAIKKHPGFAAYAKFLLQDPLYVTEAGRWLNEGSIGVMPYDVGILKVAPDSKLSPILEIAKPEELANIRAGYPLALGGYPVENVMGSEVQPIKATPNLSVGMVTAITDMFMMPAEPSYRRLVHHNLPITGGSSGSPVLGPDGKLVALNSAMNILSVPTASGDSRRIPHGVLINFAQRADWLLDLLSGRADTEGAAEQAYWEKQTANFKRGIEVLVPNILNELKPQPGAKPVLVEQNKFTLAGVETFTNKDAKGKDVKRRQRIHPIKLSAGKPQVIVAYAESRQPLQLYVVIDGKIVAQDDRNTTFVPNLRYTATADASADVYVVGPDADVKYTLFEYGYNVPGS